MKLKYTLVALLFASASFAQSHVFGGAEATLFGTVDLGTPASATWTTDRGATPGYYSAVGGAVYTNASDVNNIDGYVKHYATAADQSFSFPIGTGSDYRNLTISGTIPATSVTAAAWTAGDPGNTTSLASAIQAVSSIGYWNWQDLSSDNAGATITVSIPDVSGFATQPNLRLVGYNGTQWVDLSGAATATGNTENSTLSGILQNNITAIGIGSIATALPVNLTKFTATAKGGTALLEWTVGVLNQLKGFQVQVSADGSKFNTIGFVSITGSNHYRYVAPLSQGPNYYRLILVDLENNLSYGPISQVSRTAAADVHLYPNPVSDQLHFSNLTEGTNQITIFNMAGQRVLNATIEGASGVVNVNFLANGVYMVKITNNKAVFTERIIKR